MIIGRAKITLRKHSLAATELDKSVPKRMTAMSPSTMANHTAALDSTVKLGIGSVGMAGTSPDVPDVKGEVDPRLLAGVEFAVGGAPPYANLRADNDEKEDTELEPAFLRMESASMLPGWDCCGEGTELDGIARGVVGGLELADNNGKRAFSRDDGVEPKSFSLNMESLRIADAASPLGKSKSKGEPGEEFVVLEPGECTVER